jgi:tetratricopeptide (TPR) repeat protein
MGKNPFRLQGSALAVILILLSVPEAPAKTPAALNQAGLELFRTGRLEEAAALFEEALEEDPGSEDILRNLSGTLASLGRNSFQSGGLDTARDYLERAIELWPHEAAYHLILGAVYFRLGELYAARRAVDGALDRDENNPQARELLGDIDYQEGFLSRAVPEWEAALENAGPHASRLQQKIARAKKEMDAESEFEREVSLHFTMQYDGPISDQLAQSILKRMEEAYDLIGDEMGHYPAGDIPVILYSRILFNEITRSPLWAAGAFDGKIRVPVGGLSSGADSSRLNSILAHELAHAFIRSMAPTGLPLWFQEGLAEHFEGMPTEVARHFLQEIGIPPPTTFADLDRGLRGQGASVEASYLAALLAVRLFIDEEGFWTLRQVIETVGEGASFVEALRQETGMDPGELEEKWRNALP